MTDNNKLAKLQQQYAEKPNKEKKSPRRYRLMFTKQLAQGLTNKECAKLMGVTVGTYRSHKQRNEAKEWIAKVKEFLDDPVHVTRIFLKDEQVENLVELVTIAEVAKESGDYATAARVRTKLAEWAGVPESIGRDGRGGDAAIKITLNVTPEQLQSPAIETEYEVIEDEEDED